MRLAVLFLVAADSWQLLGAEASTATHSSPREVIKREFHYDPTKRAALEKATEADGKAEGAVVKMDPFHVLASKYPPASAVVTPRGPEGIDLNAERHLFPDALRRTPVEIGILKHRDIIPFGASVPRWDILRLKW